MPSLQSLLPQFYRNPSLSTEDTETHKRATLIEIFKSYGVDWALVLVLWALLSWLNHQPGYKREFSLDRDISIQHTFAVHERVPVSAFCLCRPAGE